MVYDSEMVDIEQVLETDPHFCHWLAGFIAGEGCFRIGRWGGYYGCDFTMCLRDDDQPILEQICEKVGLGSIEAKKSVTNPQAVWIVRRKEECSQLVWLLDHTSLRARKQNDFRIWRQAVRAWEQLDQETMAPLYTEIQLVRKYYVPSGGSQRALPSDSPSGIGSRPSM